MDYKKEIKKQGRTQKWVAEQIGMSPEVLSMKLNGIGRCILTEANKKDLDKILNLKR